MFYISWCGGEAFSFCVCFPTQALQMAPATMPEAVNPNIIVQQPLVSMSGVSHGDLDPGVVQTSAVSVVSTQQAHNAATATTAYVTTPMTEDGQVGWLHAWCGLRSFRKGAMSVYRIIMMMMSWCLMSSDVSWHIRDKLWPVLKHSSINLYVHGNQKAH